MIGLLIFAALGWIVAILCNFSWYKLAEDQNEDWSDFCHKQNEDWSDFCKDQIKRFYGIEDKEGEK